LETEALRAVESVRAGRVEDFALVVRHYQQDVWRLAAWALRDVSGTEELVQEVFVKAYLALDSFRADGDLGAWLRTIARNQVREELRRRAREDRRLKVYGEELAARLVDEASAAAAEDRAGRLREALSRCRQKLADDAAQAVRLRYEDALGFEDIAARLGRSAAAVKQLLVRARLALRRCVEGTANG
jgi:RNA polymerase sigma-70 factor (ECF subfamily)